jgi:hypothetical protein
LSVAKEGLAIQQTNIDVVDTHRTVVGAAHAAEDWSVSSSVGDILVLVCSLRTISTSLDESVNLSRPDESVIAREY